MTRELQVLHVDDDPQVTRMIAKRLARHGWSVTQLNDPTQALSVLAGGTHRIVLLDIDMSGINGLQLLTEIKKYDGGIQVIMLTGLVTMSNVLQSLRWGAEACLFKPIQRTEPLLDALNDVRRKLDRWWETLDELSRLRRAQQAAPVAEPASVAP